MKRIIILSISILTAAFNIQATVINVPGDYPSIQAGINAANPGDTVLVAPGFYSENVQMGEGITLLGSGAENTIIDAGGSGDVISAILINNLAIEGFTVQNSGQGSGSPGNIGIFINPQSSYGTKKVKNCIVQNCGKGIDIWNDFGGTAYIEHNLICDNIYDGFSPYLGTVYLTNNTIVDNGRDGYTDWSGGGYVQIQNNIFANNGRYGIFKHLNTPVYISYNDVWNNAEGAYYQGYSGPYQPFIPNPGTGEIAADPLFAGGTPYCYHLTWANFPTPDSTMSPCIDVGNPNSPLDPDLTRADMGAYYFNQTVYNVNVSLTPSALPIQIPYSAGGSFDYNVEIASNEAFAVNFDVWIKVSPPERLVTGPVDMTLGGGASISRDRTQNVPASVLPIGNYSYEIFVGSYPFPVWDSDNFTFEIIPGMDRVEGKAHLGIKPNPFNPSTAISYQLTADSYVKLAVYDVTGREVALLAEGYKAAGVYETVFNASHLSSGIYFARLITGDITQTQKIMLVK